MTTLKIIEQIAGALLMALRGRGARAKTSNKSLCYIPGIFIPASRFAKLGLDMDLNIFFICAY
jgi:hypothetical protein